MILLPKYSNVTVKGMKEGLAKQRTEGGKWNCLQLLVTISLLPLIHKK